MYVNQFQNFAKTVLPGGSLIYYDKDKNLKKIASVIEGIHLTPYDGGHHSIEDGQAIIRYKDQNYPMQVFGQHNFENMSAAVRVCFELGVPMEDALYALTSFEGTAKRLEKVYDQNDLLIFRDFAHSPSKVRATVNAVKSTYPDHHVIAVLELHTFSSLSKDFLPFYHETMEAADQAFVHFNKHVFELKRMKVLSSEEVKTQFGHVEVETDIEALWTRLQSERTDKTVYLMMSSGSFGGKNLMDLV